MTGRRQSPCVAEAVRCAGPRRCRRVAVRSLFAVVGRTFFDPSKYVRNITRPHTTNKRSLERVCLLRLLSCEERVVAHREQWW